MLNSVHGPKTNFLFKSIFQLDIRTEPKFRVIIKQMRTFSINSSAAVINAQFETTLPRRDSDKRNRQFPKCQERSDAPYNVIRKVENDVGYHQRQLSDTGTYIPVYSFFQKFASGRYYSAYSLHHVRGSRENSGEQTYI
ncbi:hypothetical protein PUN28_011778 [Cardiocondyla obscurior]|uniref:Uncharacterized protein n=1 Tax=Cardiocondyla obscurior TaxID=286306 RepID=A0AAW2FIX6_9HYME